MAPALSLATYFAAVVPPAPPPITTTFGLACARSAGAPSIIVPASAAAPVSNCLRLTSIGPSRSRWLSGFGSTPYSLPVDGFHPQTSFRDGWRRHRAEIGRERRDLVRRKPAGNRLHNGIIPALVLVSVHHCNKLIVGPTGDPRHRAGLL